MQKYLSSVPGVRNTEAGFANGSTEHPTYEEVCRNNTGHAETVKVTYDPEAVSLGFLLGLYFDAIDPTSVNRQGGDSGIQYRTGIYYENPADGETAREAVRALQDRIGRPVAVEVKPLENYSPAEEYHQNYLDKNPGGYCHISARKIGRAAGAAVDPARYAAPDAAELKRTLSPEEYSVTQESETEPPFQNRYWDRFEPGIYVDVTTGEPLFLSDDKFESGCGWPSFTKPVDPSAVRESEDRSHGMLRTEIKSRVGNAHLGHVFPDGPREAGGMRYCINSAALRFVPEAEMEKEGYGYLLPLLKTPGKQN